MKKTVWIFALWIGIPFAASLAGLAFYAAGWFTASFFAVPICASLLIWLLRTKIPARFGAVVCGICALALLILFTLLMLITSGSIESPLMASFNTLLFPFSPILFVYVLLGENLLLYLLVFLTYLSGFALLAPTAKLSIKKTSLCAAFMGCCLLVCSALYVQRPAAKYSGHGFEYMNGYSSTDFSDCTVYANPSKLALLDHEPSFTIENETEMPVMDGAEACYPLYAAFAKAVYKNIDLIEQNWIRNTANPYTNGKIVSFTNTSWGFTRLLNEEQSGQQVSMFFGAYPSKSQLEQAAEAGIELEITPIAKEAFVFFVPEDNPVDSLTTEQIKAIYHGDLTNWSEVGGVSQNILAFQRPESSGSQAVMESFMGTVSLKEPQTYEINDAMAGVIHEVAQYHSESGAIGYSFRYFLEELNQEKNVKLLKINGIEPTLENIKNGTYPLTVDVCLITRSNETNPYVSKMKQFILSEDGQSLIEKTGYAPLIQ